VTGDLRNKRGHLRRLPAMVDAAHEQAGMPLVNDHIVVTPLGGKYGVLWRSWAGRSATRVHQHAHTYIRGDRRRAAARLRAPGGGGGGPGRRANATWRSPPSPPARMRRQG